jgi:hypothetical protein
MNLGTTTFAQLMYFLPLAEFRRSFEPASVPPPVSGDLVLDRLRSLFDLRREKQSPRNSGTNLTCS